MNVCVSVCVCVCVRVRDIHSVLSQYYEKVMALTLDMGKG